MLPIFLEELARRMPGPESPLEKLQTLLQERVTKMCTTKLMREIERRADLDEAKGGEGIGRAKRWRKAARQLGIIAGVRT